MLAVLGELEKKLKEKNAKAVEKNLGLLWKEFDKHSLNKEEKVLFPEFEEFVLRENGPTGMMIAEHQELVESMKRFRLELETRDFEKLNETGSYIIHLLRQHIDKENNILFNMIDMHLGEKQRKKVLQGFRELDSKGRD